MVKQINTKRRKSRSEQKNVRKEGLVGQRSAFINYKLYTYFGLKHKHLATDPRGLLESDLVFSVFFCVCSSSFFFAFAIYNTRIYNLLDTVLGTVLYFCC